MFRNLFKKNTKSTEIIKEVAVPCVCDRGNEHCDLILKLRECQDLRNKIKNEIEILNKNNCESIDNFVDFLRKLVKNGLRVDYLGRYEESLANIHIVEDTLHEYSSTDILRITEELKIYKNIEDVICEKRRVLKTVEDDIENIKSKLGIE